MRIVVTGTRGFSDYTLFKLTLDELVGKFDQVKIIYGGCRGPDKMAAKYAQERAIPFTEYPANWNKYGKSAGPRRNKEMAQAADLLLAFWDGSSAGTQNMIKEMALLGKPFFIVGVPL